MNSTDRETTVLDAAKKAQQHAYAPYTHRAIGAAVECAGGRIFVGSTVELASWAGSLCAEGVAIGSAIAAGERNFHTLALYPDSMPCGICRQMIVEFNPSLEILVERDGRAKRIKITDLLPHHFGPSNLQF